MQHTLCAAYMSSLSTHCVLRLDNLRLGKPQVVKERSHQIGPRTINDCWLQQPAQTYKGQHAPCTLGWPPVTAVIIGPENCTMHGVAAAAAAVHFRSYTISDQRSCSNRHAVAACPELAAACAAHGAHKLTHTLEQAGPTGQGCIIPQHTHAPTVLVEQNPATTPAQCND